MNCQAVRLVSGKLRRNRQILTIHHLVTPARKNGGAERTRRRSPLHRAISCRRRALADGDVVEVGKGWITRPTIIMVIERQRISMSWYDMRRNLHPCVIVGAGVR